MSLRALDRKLLRDAWRLRGQVISIALVVTAGVMSVVTMRTTFRSLEASRDAYYAEYRFADVFASLNRAPEPLARRIAEIPGVASVQTRVTAPVVLLLPGLDQHATGRIVSIPDVRAPMLNDLHLREGRWIAPGSDDEVLVSERFALANELAVGDTIAAVINGRYRQLRIAGTALSPEFIYEIEPTAGFVGDERLFGVLWMGRSALAAARGMEGAFNDVALSLSPGASLDDVLARLDGLLTPYGGLGAYGQEDQLSNRILDDEIGQNRAIATVIPIMFLGIAAFLLHMVMLRLVDTQRTEIAMLKAFGYTDGAVAAHYLGFALLAVAIGAVLGTVLGFWLGASYTALYSQYFRFPELRYLASGGVALTGIGISAAAALFGARSAVQKALRVQPAEGMRAAPPARFRTLILERWGLHRWLTSGQRMMLRNLERRPIRAATSALGVALALAVVVTGFGLLDSMRGMVELQFQTVQREDMAVTFNHAVRASAVEELARLPGVVRSEPVRAAPVRLVAGHRSRRLGLTGISPTSELRVMTDANGGRHALPPAGLVLTSRLADVLETEPGDTVRIELLDRASEERTAVIAGTVDEAIGLNAYAPLPQVNQLLREGPTVTGALLSVQRGAESEVFRELRDMPAVSGASSKSAMMRTFENQMEASGRITALIVVVLAGVLAAGVIYNGARIALSERARELAGLRVLGFYRREVAAMLLGEQAVITLVALPLGAAIGYGLGALIIGSLDTEMYGVPLVFRAEMLARSIAIILGIAAVAALLVRRRMERTDLVAALKVRE